MLIDQVFNIDHRIIIAISRSFFDPQVGDVYSCGDDSWKVCESEKFVFGKMPNHNNTSYLLHIIPIKNSEKPLRGYVVDRKLT
jgi:hypothetical protein